MELGVSRWPSSFTVMVQNPNSETLSAQKVGETSHSHFKDSFQLFTLFMPFWKGFLKKVEGWIWPFGE